MADTLYDLMMADQWASYPAQPPGYYLDPANSGYGSGALGAAQMMGPLGPNLDYSRMPVSENIDDRRRKLSPLDKLGHAASELYHEDYLSNIVNALVGAYKNSPPRLGSKNPWRPQREGVMVPFDVTPLSQLMLDSGAYDLMPFGFTPQQMRQFQRGETPGSMPFKLDKVYIPGRE